MWCWTWCSKDRGKIICWHDLIQSTIVSLSSWVVFKLVISRKLWSELMCVCFISTSLILYQWTCVYSLPSHPIITCDLSTVTPHKMRKSRWLQQTCDLIPSHTCVFVCLYNCRRWMVSWHPICLGWTDLASINASLNATEKNTSTILC